MRLSFASLLAVASLGSAAAFHPVATKLASATRLHAEGGAPQYQKNDAVLGSVEKVSEGNYLLSVKYNNGDYGDDAKYEPGNVLALEIQPPARVGARRRHRARDGFLRQH